MPSIKKKLSFLNRKPPKHPQSSPAAAAAIETYDPVMYGDLMSTDATRAAGDGVQSPSTIPTLDTPSFAVTNRDYNNGYDNGISKDRKPSPASPADRPKPLIRSRSDNSFGNRSNGSCRYNNGSPRNMSPKHSKQLVTVDTSLESYSTPQSNVVTPTSSPSVMIKPLIFRSSSARSYHSLTEESSDDADVVLLRQQLRDAQRVVKAVLGVDDVTDASPLKAIRQYAAMKTELAGVQKQYAHEVSQRKELETQWTRVCMERNKQSMLISSLEQELHQQQRELSTLQPGQAFEPSAKEQELESQLRELQFLLDQRQSELNSLQDELVRSRQEQQMMEQRHQEEQANRFVNSSGQPSDLATLQNALEEAREEIDELEQERQYNMTEIVDLSKEILQLKRMRDNTTDMSALIEQNAQLEEKLQETQLELKAVSESHRMLDRQVQAHQQMQQQHDILREQQRDELEQKYLQAEKDLKQQLKEWQETASSTAVEARELDDRYQTSEYNLLKIKEVVEEQDKQLEIKTLDLEEKEAKLAGAEVELKDAFKKINNLEEELLVSQQQITCRPTEDDGFGTAIPNAARTSLVSAAANVVALDAEAEHRQEMESLQKVIRRSKSAIESLKAQIQESKSNHTADVRELKESAQKLELENVEMKAKIEVFEEGRNESDDTNDMFDLKMQLRISQATLVKLQSEMIDSKIRIEELSSKEAQFDSMEFELETKSAKVKDLERDLATSQKKVEKLSRDVQDARETSFSSVPLTPDSGKERERERERENLEQKVTELETQVSEKEQDLLLVKEQLSELQNRLQLAQSEVEDLELERNFHKAKEFELNRLLKVDTATEAEKELYAKAVECAELSTKLETAEKELGFIRKRNDKLEQEREVNIDKVAELSSIWDSHIHLETARDQLSQHIIKVAAMLEESQAQAEQLEAEKEISVYKASTLSVKLAEKSQELDELSEKLEMERQANINKDRVLKLAGIDINDAIIDEGTGRIKLTGTSLDNSRHGAGDSPSSYNQVSTFFSNIKHGLMTSPTAVGAENNERISELEETVTQQQVTIAKLKRSNTAETVTTDTSLLEESAGSIAIDPAADDTAPEAKVLSTEEAQELTIRRLMKKIETLEEEKEVQCSSVEDMKRRMEEARRENVARSIKIEALEKEVSEKRGRTLPSRPASSETPAQDDAVASDDSNQNKVLEQLRLTSTLYNNSVETLRAELSQLRTTLVAKTEGAEECTGEDDNQAAEESAELSSHVASFQQTNNSISSIAAH